MISRAKDTHMVVLEGGGRECWKLRAPALVSPLHKAMLQQPMWKEAESVYRRSFVATMAFQSDIASTMQKLSNPTVDILAAASEKMPAWLDTVRPTTEKALRASWGKALANVGTALMEDGEAHLVDVENYLRVVDGAAPLAKATAEQSKINENLKVKLRELQGALLRQKVTSGVEGFQQSMARQPIGAHLQKETYNELFEALAKTQDLHVEDVQELCMMFVTLTEMRMDIIVDVCAGLDEDSKLDSQVSPSDLLAPLSALNRLLQQTCSSEGAVVQQKLQLQTLSTLVQLAERWCGAGKVAAFAEKSDANPACIELMSCIKRLEEAEDVVKPETVQEYTVKAKAYVESVGEVLIETNNKELNKALKSLEKLLGLEGRKEGEKLVWWNECGRTPTWAKLNAAAEKSIMAEPYVKKLKALKKTVEEAWTCGYGL